MASSILFGDLNSGLQVGNNHGRIDAQFHLTTERSEIYNTQGGAIFSGNLTAIRGINIHHITTIRPLAHSLYKSLFTSSDFFGQVGNELGLLVSVLNATEEHTQKVNADNAQLPELHEALNKCHHVLCDLSQLKEHFDNVGPQTQVTWERMGWGVDELVDIRAKLLLYIQVLNVLNTNMIRSSQENVEHGITPEIFSLNRNLILTSLQALSQNEVEDYHINFATANLGQGDSSPGMLRELTDTSDTSSGAEIEDEMPVTTAADADLYLPEEPLNVEPHFPTYKQGTTPILPSGKKSNRVARLLYRLTHPNADLVKAVQNGNLDEAKTIKNVVSSSQAAKTAVTHKRTSPPQLNLGTASPYNVLFVATSMYDFNIDPIKTEAGYPYLIYGCGQTFSVVAEIGVLWLAFHQEDSEYHLGWLWHMHFAKIS
ncbi:hypothetical protein N7451_001521 [Penicillium sp. IBT 35674x]|nr:hypothetical protein N7451_001521 [Penicillium sp. IBT 35674x]